MIKINEHRVKIDGIVYRRDICEVGEDLCINCPFANSERCGEIGEEFGQCAPNNYSWIQVERQPFLQRKS